METIEQRIDALEKEEIKKVLLKQLELLKEHFEGPILPKTDDLFKGTIAMVQLADCLKRYDSSS